MDQHTLLVILLLIYIAEWIGISLYKSRKKKKLEKDP